MEQVKQSLMTNSRFAINLQLDDNVAVYADTARAAEGDGFAMVTAADHPGTCASPAAVLGALAVATSTIQLCGYVINAGTHEPLDLASEIATIDQLSAGRAIFGVGAGHTPAEWTMYGRQYPSSGARVDRLVEVVDVTTRLLAGETVTFRGEHIHTVDAALARPRPARERIPVLIGGGGRRVLELAGRMADVLSYTGLGRTLEDGHRHEVKWSDDDTASALDIVRSAAAAAGRTPPVVDILVQYNVITDDRDAVLAKLLGSLPLSPDDRAKTPFMLVGTIAQQVEQVHRNREKWGITSYTVRDREAGAALIAALD
jgi:probable F420-dependent oxidoreductase